MKTHAFEKCSACDGAGQSTKGVKFQKCQKCMGLGMIARDFTLRERVAQLERLVDTFKDILERS